ncbi:MAG: peptidase [Elainellaceae cyanobacterium]
MISFGLASLWIPAELPLAFPVQALPQPLEPALPPARIHLPLPRSLAEWRDSENSGDYFSAIEPTRFGYLVWSEFPVKVYLDSHQESRSQLNDPSVWTEAVVAALDEWTVYVPLAQVASPDDADIAVWRRTPSIQDLGISRDDLLNGNYRIRSAETRYEFRLTHSPDFESRLTHRFDIFLSPNQTAQYIQASARHELGHALGIWGHSPVEADAMYFSQVRQPARISARDINTLKKIYEQPTQLGWPVNVDESNEHVFTQEANHRALQDHR